MTQALPRVFISYRRSDSLSATGRLYDRLNMAYPGMFFRDVSGIGVGVDFTQEIERAVSSSVALIAVIGPTWASQVADGRRRLDDPDDFVRLELSSAIKRNVRILPVLVGGASMPEEEQLPPDLHPLRKWNAIQLVEEYYEEGIERLIGALRSQLGEPRTQERIDRAEAERKLKDLRGTAEAALAVEDWFAGIQALQAAVSLDPNNSDLSARLRWAHDHHKAAGLYAEGQALYEQGNKSAALGRFRQVRMAAGNYRNVAELVQQLERELVSETRRSAVRRWTAGAVAAVCVSIVAAGALVVWVVRSEFADASTEATEIDSGMPDRAEVSTGVPITPLPGAPAANSDPVTAPQRAPAEATQLERAAGVGFPGRGRWRITARENEAMSILLDLNDDGSFAVSMPAGVMDVPLSGGRYTYNSATGMLQIAGVNNLDAYFTEVIHVFERENDHFHANYLGSVWELRSEE